MMLSGVVRKSHSRGFYTTKHACSCDLGLVTVTFTNAADVMSEVNHSR